MESTLSEMAATIDALLYTLLTVSLGYSAHQAVEDASPPLEPGQTCVMAQAVAEEVAYVKCHFVLLRPTGMCPACYEEAQATRRSHMSGFTLPNSISH